MTFETDIIGNRPPRRKAPSDSAIIDAPSWDELKEMFSGTYVSRRTAARSDAGLVSLETGGYGKRYGNLNRK